MKKTRGILLKVVKVILYGVYLFLVVLILLEVLLRMYDPFVFRLKANRIILPINQKEIITNKLNPKLDSSIIVTRNSLGFRGPDTPRNFGSQISIITIGGSTTACHFLNDENTWPYLLGEFLRDDFANVWVNNAGFDGHSTFGHTVLLNDYVKKLNPKIVIFLTGVNDIENEGPSYFDKLKNKNEYPDMLNYLYNNSEVVNVIVNFARGARAKKFNNTTQDMKLPGALGTLDMTVQQRNKRLHQQEKYLTGYEMRLAALIDTCKRNNILPVLLTQPCLYGYTTDSVTHINLSTAKVEEGMNGALLSDLLDQYNNKVKEVCTIQSVPFIDLAALMPKNSLYYYDQTHYTNEGAREVAKVVAEKMRDILRGRY
jgi:lysophospholipase L1-like esterase